jgi:hypothetical protein
MTEEIERPQDAHEVRLSGRVLALEIMMVRLLRQEADAMQTLREANWTLDSIESRINRMDAGSHYQMLVFEAARQSLTKIEDEVRRGNPTHG